MDLIDTSQVEARTHLDELMASSQVLRRVAMAGLDSENETTRYQMPDSVEQCGPWRALSLRRTEILRGPEIKPLTQNDGALALWRDQLLNAQTATVMCVPLIARGRALGIVTLISTDAAHNLGKANSGLIEDLARNAALMVDNARLLREMQEANRAKDEFLAVLSHELRTPLTAILGWVQLLGGSGLDDDTRQRALSTIERNTYAQVQLIEDMLDLSRIVTGKLRLEISSLNLEPIIEAAMDAVRPAAQAKEIELFASLLPDDGFVMGDAHRLQQVLWNLLSNAVKFTPKGGRVEVSMQRLESYIEITVRDSGRGISAEFLPYVFDRFRQADSSSTRQHGGLGLGLAIVRHVTELHGGTVQAESKGEDKGTTFKIILPVAPLTVTLEPQGKANAKSDAIEVKPVADFSRLLDDVRVLLVDDERDAREMLGAALRRYGAQVQICASVPEALADLTRLAAARFGFGYWNAGPRWLRSDSSGARLIFRAKWQRARDGTDRLCSLL